MWRSANPTCRGAVESLRAEVGAKKTLDRTNPVKLKMHSRLSLIVPIFRPHGVGSRFRNFLNICFPFSATATPYVYKTPWKLPYRLGGPDCQDHHSLIGFLPMSETVWRPCMSSRMHLHARIAQYEHSTKALSCRVDYSVINPANKWRMLREQWRFALWCTCHSCQIFHYIVRSDTLKPSSLDFQRRGHAGLRPRRWRSASCLTPVPEEIRPSGGGRQLLDPRSLSFCLELYRPGL